MLCGKSFVPIVDLRQVAGDLVDEFAVKVTR